MAIQLFEIFALNNETVKKAIENPASRQRNDYEELIIITDGQPQFSVDFQKVPLSVPGLIYVALGKMHEFLPDLNTKGWCIRYNEEYLPQTNFHFYSRFSDETYYKLDSKYCEKNIEALCLMISTVFLQSPRDNNLIKLLLVALLLTIESSNCREFQPNTADKTPDSVSFNLFLKILERNYKKSEAVQFYADKMNSSIRTLNRITNVFFGKSVSAIIETRKISEARKLLWNSNKTVSEIGFALGFAEKSYFTRVFHKKTGFTPTHFRAALNSATS